MKERHLYNLDSLLQFFDDVMVGPLRICIKRGKPLPWFQIYFKLTKRAIEEKFIFSNGSNI